MPPTIASPTTKQKPDDIGDFMTGLSSAMRPSSTTPPNPTATTGEGAAPNQGGDADVSGASVTVPSKASPPSQPATTSPDPQKPAVGDPGATTPPPGADHDEKIPRDAKGWKAYKESRKVIEDQLKTERDAIKAERDALNGQIAELRKTAGNTTEIDELKTQLKGATERLRQLDLVNDPQFRAHFEGRINTEIEDVKAVLPPEIAGKAQEILAMPESAAKRLAAKEFGEQLDPADSINWNVALSNVRKINAERAREIANVQANATVLEQKRQAAALKAQQDMESLVESTLGELKGSDEFKPFFSDDTAKTAKAIVMAGTKDPKDFIKVVSRGLAYTPLLQQLANANTEIKALQTKLAEMTAANPSTRSGVSDAGATTTEPRSFKTPKGYTDDMIDSIQRARREGK